jgi:hypothetical protein
VTASLSSSCCCVSSSSSSLHYSWSCMALYSSHAFSNNCSLTFTSCMSTVSGKLSTYFLTYVILALTAARFLMFCVFVNPWC